MALTGSWGGNAVTTTFRTPVKLGVTVPSGQYPNGTVSVNISSSASPSRAWQRVSGSSTNISINLYLCDSSGNNKVKIFTVSGFTSQANFLYTPTSATISNSSKLLSGKALYLVATGDTSYVGTYGKITITINTSTATYTVSKAVDPVDSGSVTLGSTSAASGASVSISATPASGYTFSNWTTTGGTITNASSASTTLKMPSKNVTVTAHFEEQSQKSTFTMDKSTYYGGDTAVMTINAESSGYRHQYRLYFNDEMDTGIVDVPAGVSSVNIYIPIEWSFHLKGGTYFEGGQCYLRTYDGNTYLGYNRIDNITYTAMNNTIPAMTLHRVDDYGDADIYGEYGWYNITVPSGISNYSLAYGNHVKQNPVSSGFVLPEEKFSMPQGENHMVTLTMTYGSETITISKDIPKVIIVIKSI